MENMPFICGKCGNWYTAIPMPEDMMCAICAEGRHAVNNKTGEYDCHWGHMTSTVSEVKMTALYHSVQSMRGTVEQASGDVERAKNEEAVTTALAHVEQRFAQLERSLGGIPEIIRWAGVKEMPGMKGEPSTRRFMSLEGIETLVADNRRPKTDLDELKRSIKTCDELSNEVTNAVAMLRTSMSGVRRQAETWTPLVVAEPELSMKPAAVAARAKTARKRALATVGR